MAQRAGSLGSETARRSILRSRLNAHQAWERIVKGICFLCAFLSIATTIGIVVILVSQAQGFFQNVSVWEFLTGRVWEPIAGHFGFLPLVCGTLLITVGAGLVSLPLGLLIGIFLAEYARPPVRKILKPALELLAGIPTVVYGYFALFFVTPILQRVIPSTEAFNAASGAIVVGIMTLPLVSSLCEDALAAVPKALREGAYGLGATKFEVVSKVVVPSAMSGVMASFILALSRAIGETMAVTLASGSTPNFTLNPTQAVMTMTAYIVNTSRGDVERGSTAYQTIFAVGLTLFITTLLMNLLAQRLIRKFGSRYS
ncbi:MAG: phosphate ABC transporter permease subunit PstC [Armatimonadetes bacterium]|nr:phosphate ABC transporter permease subunit PstC [Armatimonadota bacterium]